MPVVTPNPTLASPPSNIYGLYQYVASRVPGYDPTEYTRELNSAYIHVWEEVSKLKNHYFTNIQNVTVATAGFTFDLLYNSNGGLTAPLSNRLYQITRIRVQPPQGGLFQTCQIMAPSDPDYLSIASNPTSQPTGTGPYYVVLMGRGTLQWGLPLQTGTTIEVMYSFWPLSLTYLFGGTISNIGQVVTGTSTNFTQLVQPDFSGNLPTGAYQEDSIQSELIVAGEVGGPTQVYRVVAIASDTSLQTQSAIVPLLSNAPYILSAVPEIPREHIRVIASIATQKMYSIAGDDARSREWAAISTANVQMMKDSLIERQSNNVPKKIRFPYGISRRNRAFLR